MLEGGGVQISSKWYTGDKNIITHTHPLYVDVCNWMAVARGVTAAAV